MSMQTGHVVDAANLTWRVIDSAYLVPWMYCWTAPVLEMWTVPKLSGPFAFTYPLESIHTYLYMYT